MKFFISDIEAWKGVRIRGACLQGLRATSTTPCMKLLKDSIPLGLPFPLFLCSPLNPLPLTSNCIVAAMGYLIPLGDQVSSPLVAFCLRLSRTVLFSHLFPLPPLLFTRLHAPLSPSLVLGSVMVAVSFALTLPVCNQWQLHHVSGRPSRSLSFSTRCLRVCWLLPLPSRLGFAAGFLSVSSIWN